MKLNLLIVATLSVVAFGCSSKQTASDASAASASPTPAPTATPAPAAHESASAVNCEKGADKRKIEVVSKGKGCEVHYTKGANTETPARSSNGTGHCEKTRDKIKGTLVSAGFKCS